MFNKFSYTHGNSFVAKKKSTHLSNSQRMICWHDKVKQPKFSQNNTAEAIHPSINKNINQSYS